MINTWFKFEDKIQNTSKVVFFDQNNHEVNEKISGGTVILV